MNKKRTANFAITLAAILGIFLFSAVNRLALFKEVTIKGSTTVLPIVQSCAETFMANRSDVSLSVQGGGSGLGIASLIDGTCEIASSSRSMKSKEIQRAKEKNVVPYENVIARDALAVIIHPSNPLDKVTRQQLKKIYTGEISNWSQLGGHKGKIVVISRDTSSGTFETFNDLVLEKKRVRPDALFSASNQAVAQTVKQTPAAIGYIGHGYLSPVVKAIAVDGVYPELENLKNATYVLTRNLYMYTNGEPKGPVKDFIEFVLSEEGQNLVQKAGFLPVK